MAPEDIIPVFEGVFVGSSQERRKHMMMSVGAEATEDGGLFAIWNVDTPGQVRRVTRRAIRPLIRRCHRLEPFPGTSNLSYGRVEWPLENLNEKREITHKFLYDM